MRGWSGQDIERLVSLLLFFYVVLTLARLFTRRRGGRDGECAGAGRRAGDARRCTVDGGGGEGRSGGGALIFLFARASH